MTLRERALVSPRMGLSRFIRRRWAVHNQRLLGDQLYARKDASDPGGIVGGATAAAAGGAADRASEIKAAEALAEYGIAERLAGVDSS